MAAAELCINRLEQVIYPWWDTRVCDQISRFTASAETTISLRSHSSNLQGDGPGVETRWTKWVTILSDLSQYGILSGASMH